MIINLENWGFLSLDKSQKTIRTTSRNPSSFQWICPPFLRCFFYPLKDARLPAKKNRMGSFINGSWAQPIFQKKCNAGIEQKLFLLIPKIKLLWNMNANFWGRRSFQRFNMLMVVCCPHFFLERNSILGIKSSSPSSSSSIFWPSH